MGKYLAVLFLWMFVLPGTKLFDISDLYNFRCPHKNGAIDLCYEKKYPIRTWCRRYWQCTEGCEATEMRCDRNQQFSYTAQDCVPYGRANCRTHTYYCSHDPHSGSHLRLNCPPELVMTVNKADVGTNAEGCADHHMCCPPGADRTGGCREMVKDGDPRLDDLRAKCDGQPTCLLDILPTMTCNGSQSTPDFQYLMYSCLATTEYHAYVCGYNTTSPKLSLDCYNNKVIHITRSVTGQRDPHAPCTTDVCCPDVSDRIVEMSHDHSCLAHQVALCEGQASCDHVDMVSASCAGDYVAHFQYLFFECVSDQESTTAVSTTGIVEETTYVAPDESTMTTTPEDTTIVVAPEVTPAVTAKVTKVTPRPTNTTQILPTTQTQRLSTPKNINTDTNKIHTQTFKPATTPKKPVWQYTTVDPDTEAIGQGDSTQVHTGQPAGSTGGLQGHLTSTTNAGPVMEGSTEAKIDGLTMLVVGIVLALTLLIVIIAIIIAVRKKSRRSKGHVLISTIAGSHDDHMDSFKDLGEDVPINCELNLGTGHTNGVVTGSEVKDANELETQIDAGSSKMNSKEANGKHCDDHIHAYSNYAYPSLVNNKQPSSFAPRSTGAIYRPPSSPNNKAAEEEVAIYTQVYKPKKKPKRSSKERKPSSSSAEKKAEESDLLLGDGPHQTHM